MPEPAKCRSCGAAVYWLRNDRTNSLAPIDAEPTHDGNCVILDETHYQTLTKDLFEQPADGPRHKNHYATCPQGRDWLRRKQGRKR